MIVGGNPVLFEVEKPRWRLFRRRRANRRTSSRSGAVARERVTKTAPSRHIGRAILRVTLAFGKIVVLLAALGGSGYGARVGIRHVVNSPRFQLQTIDYTPTAHLGQDEMLSLAGVSLGDKLLQVDTDAVAAGIAKHPWVKSVRASRRLPATLVVDVTERQAVALAAFAGLYLVDEHGRPFKRATMDEADGLPVLTGIERERYAQMRDVSEAAFRDALAVLAEYRSRPGRPGVAEISIDPGYGFSLFLLEGGAEVRLGRGNFGKKLAHFDQILEAVLAKGPGDLSSIRVVHLDLPDSGRVPVLLREPPTAQIAKN